MPEANIFGGKTKVLYLAGVLQLLSFGRTILVVRLALSSAKSPKFGYFIRILGFFRYKSACVSGLADVIHAI